MRNYKGVLFVLIGILIFSLPVSAISEEKPEKVLDSGAASAPDAEGEKADQAPPTPEEAIKEETVEPIPVDIKYLFGIDAKVSGTKLGWVDKILIDEEREEIYLLDSGSSRIVITDKDGVFLYQFNYKLSGVKNFTAFDIAPKEGDIYVVDGKKILVLNYRGAFKKELDISSIPDGDKLAIQGIDVTTVENSGRIYIADAESKRVIVLSTDGKFIKEYRQKGIGSNFAGLSVYGEEMIYLDSGNARVYRLGLDGEVKVKFGRLSSLLGGFSIPVSMAVDKAKKRIIVLDTNRQMVIVFDMKGNPLYEFGGPRVFRWPRAVAVGIKGRIYVADMTGIISVFEVKEEKPQIP